MNHTIVCAALCMTLFFLSPVHGSSLTFPPESGTYRGDYVLIDEPGRYTLENNITHAYPVGIIITSSSVILDGQGHFIRPATSNDPSVGIWVSLFDAHGKAITGVRLQNLTVQDEVTGIYLEGSDSSEFPWGRDHSSDPSISEMTSDRDITCSDSTITGSRIGFSSKDVKKPVLLSSRITGNEKGVFISEGTPEIRDLIIAENTGSGLHLEKTEGGVITGCRIEGNHGPGILLDHAEGIQIWNNILDNQVNIRNIASEGALLFQTLSNQTNIIKGPKTGGNLWAHGGIPVYAAQMIPDADQDGIGDIPYIDSGLIDQYPLIPAGTGFTPQMPDVPEPPVLTQTPAPVSTPFTIITGVHAVITGDSIPSAMQAGKSYQVNITLLNDGSDNWLDMHAVGIRALGDAATWGPAWLPVPSGIHSKQSYTIPFELTAPTKPGTYELMYQAVREGQGVSVTYGRPYKKVVTVN
ncbi:MAG TPA: NosD domain-containing protein [Methanospirillum sp.]|uniref:NosD domain-containing protein n=1 Tax=Methanospirillum sp. TaxID=45200 RepID=UPI002C74EFCC|nr:NosD domain-containing protein [Methanospirillum sp.]HOJ96385.1 NosD domain-containing protein [Methanospirillum sp.]